MDTDNVKFFIKIEYIYSDIVKDVETRFDISNCQLVWTLPKGKKKKVIGLMKDELDGKIIKEFAALRAKTYIYLPDNNNEDKKEQDNRKCDEKRELKFEDYKQCLKVTQRQKR